MSRIALDRATGLVTYTTEGFQSPEDVLEDAKRTKDIVSEARRQFGRLRMLVYKMDGVVQTKESLEAAGRIKRDYRENDRIAIVVNSSLLKMQLSRSASKEEKVFDSESEAIAWLSH